ncbi:MAG: RES family NAD+ phosphorylase [Bacteroidales bacterium]|nr:RES family NAD+ phosphorylase [Bacteroidales bacterium]
MSNIIACSNCFHDTGLKHEARKVGFQDNSLCPVCMSSSGRKLTLDLLHDLCWNYFVSGSYYKTEYGGASTLMINDSGGNDDIECSQPLKHDIQLLQRNFNISVFYYAPQMWRIGMIDWIAILCGSASRKRDHAIEQILLRSHTTYINSNNILYRLRTGNIGSTISPQEYDAPPQQVLKDGRLNVKEDVVLYAAFDIETCIHECRVAINDEMYIARLRPLKRLKLLDLTKIKESDEESTPFENLNIAMHFIFTAGNSSYKATHLLASAIYERGFDGIIYPSYFNTVRRHEFKNVALFGRPITTRKIEVECINRLVLNTVKYNYSMGPAVAY